MQLLCVLGREPARQGCHLVSVALKVVVKSQLCIGRDVLCGKQSNGQFTVHQPLLCLTVGITGVVDEPAQGPLSTNMIIRRSTAAAISVHSCCMADRVVVYMSASSAVEPGSDGYILQKLILA